MKLPQNEKKCAVYFPSIILLSSITFYASGHLEIFWKAYCETSTGKTE
jgi:hypothetical protein